MIIGVPKEIKNNENRVALTPAGAKELIKRGHTVHIQSTAGLGSGFEDSEFQKAGAHIVATIEETYEIAEMIIKVKEPIASEYELIKKTWTTKVKLPKSCQSSQRQSNTAQHNQTYNIDK